jgi:hypothetical protein
MKATKLAALGLVLGILGVCGAGAAPDGAFLGALAGAGAGLALGNNVDGIDKEWAVPVLAIGGGLLGNRLERYWDSGYWDRHYWDRPHRGHCRCHGPRRPSTPPAAPPDPHPGVDLIKVSILNSNGVRTDVNILRLRDKFVGPRGEAYDALPSSEELARKYGL